MAYKNKEELSPNPAPILPPQKNHFQFFQRWILTIICIHIARHMLMWISWYVQRPLITSWFPSCPWNICLGAFYYNLWLLSPAVLGSPFPIILGVPFIIWLVVAPQFPFPVLFPLFSGAHLLVLSWEGSPLHIAGNVCTTSIVKKRAACI